MFNNKKTEKIKTPYLAFAGILLAIGLIIIVLNIDNNRGLDLPTSFCVGSVPDWAIFDCECNNPNKTICDKPVKRVLSYNVTREYVSYKKYVCPVGDVSINQTLLQINCLDNNSYLNFQRFT